MSFNTQPPEGGWVGKTAVLLLIRSFNTQPPEGGWQVRNNPAHTLTCFNTQPPEGGWVFVDDAVALRRGVSTHSRPKAAGYFKLLGYTMTTVSTHSRPKAAGR